MRTLLMATAILTTLLAAGCAGSPSVPSAVDSPVSSSSSPSDTSDTAAPPSSSPPSATKARQPAQAPAPAGLLVEMRAASHPGYERLVFEFGGDRPPPHRIQTVEEVRHDPSDKLIPLRGKLFQVVVFDGATLDTAQWESDPAKARRYLGPERITPDLPLIKEVAVAGNFEAVLSFGVGLAGPVKVDVMELSSPARLVIDFRGQ